MSIVLFCLLKMSTFSSFVLNVITSIVLTQVQGFCEAFNDSFFILLGLFFACTCVGFSSPFLSGPLGIDCGITFSCIRLRRAAAFDVWTIYDLGVLAFPMTFPRHFISATNTDVPEHSGFISRVLWWLSKFLFWFLLLASSFSWKLCLSGICGVKWSGADVIVDLMFCPIKSWAGE